MGRRPDARRARRPLSTLVGLSLAGHVLVFGLMAALSGPGRRPPEPQVIHASLARLGSPKATRDEPAAAPARGAENGTPDAADDETAAAPAKPAVKEEAPEKTIDKPDRADREEPSEKTEKQAERRKPRASDAADETPEREERAEGPSLRDDERRRDREKREADEKKQVAEEEAERRRERMRQATADATAPTKEELAEQRRRKMKELLEGTGATDQGQNGRAQGRPDAPKNKTSGEGEGGKNSGASAGSPNGGGAGGNASGYLSIVEGRVRRQWKLPPSISRDELKGLSCMIYVRIGRDGKVLECRIEKSSDNEAFDRATESAVRRARLDPPPEEFFQKLGGEISFRFRP